MTKSPGTSRAASRVVKWPSRQHEAVGIKADLRAATAFPALVVWYKHTFRVNLGTNQALIFVMI